MPFWGERSSHATILVRVWVWVYTGLFESQEAREIGSEKKGQARLLPFLFPAFLGLQKAHVRSTDQQRNACVRGAMKWERRALHQPSGWG